MVATDTATSPIPSATPPTRYEELGAEMRSLEDLILIVTYMNCQLSADNLRDRLRGEVFHGL